MDSDPKLSAALSSVVTRAGDGTDGSLTVDGSADRSGSEAWAEERRRLNRELVRLRSRNTILEREREKSTSRCTATSERDRASALEWDSTIEWSGLESSIGACSTVKTREEGSAARRAAPAEGEPPRPKSSFPAG